MKTTIRERLAVLETELKGVKKVLWALVTATMASLGVQII